MARLTAEFRTKWGKRDSLSQFRRMLPKSEILVFLQRFLLLIATNQISHISPLSLGTL